MRATAWNKQNVLVSHMHGWIMRRWTPRHKHVRAPSPRLHNSKSPGLKEIQNDSKRCIHISLWSFLLAIWFLLPFIVMLCLFVVILHLFMVILLVSLVDLYLFVVTLCLFGVVLCLFVLVLSLIEVTLLFHSHFSLFVAVLALSIVVALRVFVVVLCLCVVVLVILCHLESASLLCSHLPCLESLWGCLESYVVICGHSVSSVLTVTLHVVVLCHLCQMSTFCIFL